MDSPIYPKFFFSILRLAVVFSFYAIHLQSLDVRRLANRNSEYMYFFRSSVLNEVNICTNLSNALSHDSEL